MEKIDLKDRKILYHNGKEKYVAPNGNFRNHQQAENIKRAFDIVKTSLHDVNQDTLWNNIKASNVYIDLPIDEIEDIKKCERWPWGSREIIKFKTILFKDMTEVKFDSKDHRYACGGLCF